MANIYDVEEMKQVLIEFGIEEDRADRIAFFLSNRGFGLKERANRVFMIRHQAEHLLSQQFQEVHHMR